MVGVVRALAVGFLFVGVHASACPNESLRLVIDYDDTTKITDVMNPVISVWNTLFSKQFFAGIPEFYRGYRTDNCAPIDVVSGGLEALSEFTRGGLHANHVPVATLNQRPSLGITIYDFKMQEFAKIHARHNGQVVALGDDTQSDYLVFTDTMKRLPGFIAAGYVHVVRGVPLPEGVTPYYSIFEVAMLEYTAGRESAARVYEAADTILKNKNSKVLFPNFAKCPESVAALSPAYRQAAGLVAPQLRALADQVDDFVTKTCVERNHRLSFISACADVLLGDDSFQDENIPAL